MSPRRLSGWEPAIRVRPDGDGWHVEREPEFTATDVASLLAFVADEESRGPHGVLMNEATDPANKNRFRAARFVDFAQAAIDRKRAEIDKMTTNDPRYGEFFIVEKA